VSTFLRHTSELVYTDFEKAFDRVDHDILLSKLNAAGIPWGLLVYMASYLRDRMQYVSYSGSDSESFATYSGIPQGSNLGPLLFSLFINDIGLNINNSNFLLYADDLKLFREITCQSDADLLQNDIDAITQWSHVNRLYFSISKCFVVSFTKVRHPHMNNYRMGDVDLLRVNETLDLGVLYRADFSFGPHIHKIVQAAFKILGFVLRTAVHFRKQYTLKILYDSLVRPVLESSSIIWSPYEANYVLEIEKVQKRFARHYYRALYGYFPYLYPSLFVNGCLDMSTLQKRRDEYLCRHFYKLLRNVIHNPDILQLLQFYVPDRYERSRNHNLFYCPTGKTNLISQSPVTRVCRLFNHLSESIDIFNIDYNDFKRKIVFIVK
jgi:hypothetical protein